MSDTLESIKETLDLIAQKKEYAKKKIREIKDKNKRKYFADKINYEIVLLKKLIKDLNAKLLYETNGIESFTT